MKKMRAFTFRGAFMSPDNFYAEVPEDWTVNYMDKFYHGIKAWWGLTFGGWAVVKDCEILGLYPESATWKGTDEQVTMENVKEKSSLYTEGCEVIPLIGGDDNHIHKMPWPAIDEAESLAEQVNRKIETGFFNEYEKGGKDD